MEEIKYLNIKDIRANTAQPRDVFDDDALGDLALSIKHNGLLQPITVRQVDGHYEIIAGERRFRACQRNNMEEVPCIIKNVDDKQSAALALIENIQREDLSAVEEGRAYKKLLEDNDMTQEMLAKQLGKSQATIANRIRLLQLPEDIQNAVIDGTLTERHGRALLGMEKKQQKKVYKQIVKKGLNVKQTEDYIAKLNAPKTPKEPKGILHGVSKSVKLAFNTIEQAVGMVNKSGVKATLEGYEEENEYKIVIRIPK